MIESPLARLSDEQIAQLGREFDAIHDEVFADLGDRDRALHRQHDRDAPQARRARAACCCWPHAAGPRGCRDHPALDGQDPREHGDRPQRHARPVGLDERSPDLLLDVGLGLRVDRRGVEALPQLRPPHLHQHPRQGPDLGYEIMRIDPHQKWHPVYLLQPFYNLVLVALFEWGVAIHDLDFEAIKQGEKSKEQLRRELQGMLRKAPPADRQGLRGLAAHQRARGRRRARGDRGRPRGAARRLRARRAGRRAPRAPSARPCARTSRPTWSATSGPTRSSSAATSPTRPTPSARMRSRTRRAAASTCASCSAPPTSRAAPVPRRQRQPRLPGRAPPLPRHAEHALRRDRAAGQGDLRALRAALQHRPVLKQLGAVQRTILRLAFPGGTPRPKPGPVPRRRRDRRARTRLTRRCLRRRGRRRRRAGVRWPGG